jgi:hypothetical protein
MEILLNVRVVISFVNECEMCYKCQVPSVVTVILSTHVTSSHFACFLLLTNFNVIYNIIVSKSSLLLFVLFYYHLRCYYYYLRVLGEIVLGKVHEFGQILDDQYWNF